MIGLIERVLFGPPARHPYEDMICANCGRSLMEVESVHRLVPSDPWSLLICGGCNARRNA